MVAGLARDSRVFHQRRGINTKAFQQTLTLKGQVEDRS
jgi:hypothetical protein